MKIILTWLMMLTTVLPFTAKAQANSKLTVSFNKYKLQPGDTLVVTAKYPATTQQENLATLEMIIENEQGGRTRLRWPLLNGEVTGKLALPDSLPRGTYSFYMAVQPRFFQVVGKVKKGSKNGSLNAMLLTKAGEWDQQEIGVDPDGSFAIRNWLFQNDALLAFSNTSGRSNQLNIAINTFLDSAYQPLAVATRQISFGTAATIAGVARIDSLGKNIQKPDARFFDQGELLPAVIVKAKTKSRAEQFNDEYANGLFKSSNERMINIMDDPSAIGFQTLLAYLQGRVAGLQINNAGFNGGGAIWRGAPVTFFLDEVRVSSQQIANIPMADIAIVKAFPPPFFGAPGGGNGGGIAVYTRRGGEGQFLPDNRTVFKIKGYTPLEVRLNMNKLSL